MTLKFVDAEVPTGGKQFFLLKIVLLALDGTRSRRDLLDSLPEEGGRGIAFFTFG